jgi:kynurenine formamidase
MVDIDSRWVAEEATSLSNWGRWGPDDEIGTWNLVTPEKIKEAAACVRQGKVFSLALPFGPKGPNRSGIEGRPNAIHLMQLTGTDAAAGVQDTMFPGPAKFADDWVIMNLSCSTQWDGFCHIFYEGRTYNGVKDTTVSSWGARRNSITKLRDRITTRAVLLDIPRALGQPWCQPGIPITPSDLDLAVKRQGSVSVGPGDVVLIRTGHLSQVRASGDWSTYAGNGDAPGLSATCGRWIAERDLAAIATDTWGAEVLPYETPESSAPLHQILLAHCGITIGEMFDLDALAEDCARDGIYEFMLVAPILPIDGAVNTPVNPQAIK